MSDCSKFNLFIDCANYKNFQEDLVINKNVEISNNNLNLLHFNVRNEYQHVQPDYRNFVTSECVFAKTDVNNYNLTGEINSVKK